MKRSFFHKNVENREDAMMWAGPHPPPNAHDEVLNPGPHNVTRVEGRGFKEVVRLKLDH